MAYKYYVEVCGGNVQDGVYGYGSNSRNARKHLIANQADWVDVYSEQSQEIVCAAQKFGDIIMVGATPKR